MLYNPGVGTLLKTKIPIFLLSMRTDELLPTPKTTIFLP